MSITLFSIMINRLLREWNMSVDDTTVLEFLLHNFISILNLAVRDT